MIPGTKMSLNRYAKRRDSNEADIVHALRAIPGVRVYLLDRPCDLLVGYRAHNILLEVKPTGRENRADQKDQAEWRKDWTGQIQVVTTIDQAINCVLNCYK